MRQAMLPLGMAAALSLVPPLLGGSHLSGAAAQAASQEARVMEDGKKEALHEWARRRLEELESGSPGTSSELPHGPDTERLWALYFLSVDEKALEEPARTLADTLAGADLPEALHVHALAGALELPAQWDWGEQGRVGLSGGELEEIREKLEEGRKTGDPLDLVSSSG